LPRHLRGPGRRRGARLHPQRGPHQARAAGGGYLLLSAGRPREVPRLRLPRGRSPVPLRRADHRPLPAAHRHHAPRGGGRGGSAAMKLAILGGGGFRVPLVYEAVATAVTGLTVDEISLHDVDPTRLRAITAVIEGLGEQLTDDGRAVHLPRLTATTD